MPRTAQIRVVGMTFHSAYPESMHRLSEIIQGSMAASIREAGDWSVLNEHGFEGPVAILKRNPLNEYDVNAIEVHVPALGAAGFVGHIPGPLAARWAPRLDRGETSVACVSAVPIDPRHPEKPGLQLDVTFHEVGCPVDPCSCNRR